jgi:integrase
MLSPRLLEVLRRYYRLLHPNARGPANPDEYLFPSWRTEHHMCSSSLQLACREAALRAGIAKRVTVHTMRHYAASRTMPRVGVRAAIHGHLNSGDAA